jgi:hypothetical protein
MSTTVVQLVSPNTHWLPAYRRREWLEPGANIQVGRYSAAYHVNRVGDDYECGISARSPSTLSSHHLRFMAAVYPYDVELYLRVPNLLLIVRAVEIRSDRPERALLEIVDIGAHSTARPVRKA